MYIVNFGRGFCGSFSMLFSEVQASCDKKSSEIFFAALHFYLYQLKNCVSYF